MDRTNAQNRDWDSFTFSEIITMLHGSDSFTIAEDQLLRVREYDLKGKIASVEFLYENHIEIIYYPGEFVIPACGLFPEMRIAYQSKIGK